MPKWSILDISGLAFATTIPLVPMFLLSWFDDAMSKEPVGIVANLMACPLPCICALLSGILASAIAIVSSRRLGYYSFCLHLLVVGFTTLLLLVGLCSFVVVTDS